MEAGRVREHDGVAMADVAAAFTLLQAVEAWDAAQAAAIAQLEAAKAASQSFDPLEPALNDDQHAKVTAVLVELTAYNIMRTLHELQAERAQILAVLNSEPYRDLAIPQVWARELDEGRYWCSMSSMYRIARAAGQSRERRAQATHPSRARPELLARGPSEVWSWDITALKGPRKGEWYKLYVVLDIFSRYVTGWLVAHAEDAVVARDFLAGAVAANQIVPHTIHADRGGSMTSKPVSEMMIDLGVRRSHSRPRCSNDNPYSEAQFKT